MGSKDDGGRGAMIAESRAMAEKARQALEKVDLPDVTKQELALKYPELILSSSEEQLGDTALSLIKEDPELQRSQELALAEMEELGQEGFSVEDKAKFEAMRRKVAGDEQAREASILADMAARGAGGSGAELAAMLSSSQEATQRASTAGEQMGAEAAKARREALTSAGQMAAQMEQGKYNRQANQASAKDQIAQFNAQVAARDTGARRTHEGQKTQTLNTQQQYNKELAQRDFDNQMRKQGGISSVYSGQAANLMNAAAMAKPKKGMGGAIGTLVGAGAGAALGGGPQGAAVGGQVGGTFGSQFADGGLASQPRGVYNPETGFYDESRLDLDDRQLAALDHGVRGTEELSMKEDQAAADASKAKDIAAYAKLASSLGGAMSQKEEATPAPKLQALPKINIGQSQFKGIDPKQKLNFYNDGGIEQDRGMAYEDGGEGVIIDSGEESYAGDMLPDRINDGEMVHNVEMQDRLNQLLQELGERRVDDAVHKDKLDINEPQQEELLAVSRGQMEPEEMSKDNIVEAKGMRKLLQMLGRE